MIDAKQFQEFAESLKASVQLFKDQQQLVTLLEGKITDLENRILDLNSRNFDQRHGYGFTDVTTAKKFVELVRAVFQRDPSVKDITEGVDTEGGYIVPMEFRDSLIMLLETYGVARQKCTIIPMAREELVMPRLTGGVQVYWVGEGATIPNTQPAFGEFRMVAKKMAALIPMTSELLADATIAVANLLATLFAQAIAKEEDRVVFTGNIDVGDPFNGILYDPNVTNYVMAGGSTAYSSMDGDVLASVIASVPPAMVAGAEWYMHRTVFNYVRTLKSSFSYGGQYLYSAPNGIEPATIWGYPFNLVEMMPGISTSGVSKPFVIFGNMQHYYIADRQQLAIARSEHVGFAADKIYVRVLQRESLQAAIPEAFTVIKTAAA